MIKLRRAAPVVALVGVALLGGAATGKLLTGSDIVDESLTGVDVRNGSLTGADIKDGSIALADLATPATGGSDRILEYVTQPRTFGSTAPEVWLTTPIDVRSFQVPTDGFYSVMHDSEFSHDVDRCENNEDSSTIVRVDGADAAWDSTSNSGSSVRAGEQLLYLKAGSPHEISIFASFGCGAGGNEWTGEVALTVDAARVVVVKR